MTTEIFITTPRAGTISITLGGTAITGTDTNFTTDDIGRVIIVRTTAGDLRAVIDSVTNETTADVVSAWTTTQSGCYFYIDYKTLDLYSDFPYSLNYTIADIRNPEARNSSFSKTIKLPGTDANNIIFDNIFEVNLEGSFNPNIRAFVIVYQNYIPVFNGNLQLLKIYRDDDKIEYDVAIFGKIGDLFQKVADKLLTDLDLSDLDEVGTAAQITSTWATPTDLFYPYLDNGRQNISVATPAYLSSQIAPAILVSRVFEDILSSVGYTCADTATLYSVTGMDKLYIPCLKEWRRKIQIDASINLALGGGVYSAWKLKIDRIRTGVTEEILMGTVGGAFSGNYLNVYSGQIELDWGDLVYMTRDIPIAGTSAYLANNNTFLTVTSLDNSYLYNSPIAYNVGTTQTFATIGPIGDQKVPLDVDSGGIFYDTYSLWDTAFYYGSTPVKHTQGFLPDNYKQRDFLISLIKMFNLYLEPVFDNDTQINILPRDTYYSQGSVVDWTTKLDVGQTIEFTPMGELDWKEYLFSFKEDADFWNKDYKAKTFENYGQRTVIVENDFIATKKSIIPEVAPFPLRQSAYNSLVLSNCIKDGVSTIPNIYTGILRVIYYDETAFNANQTPGATTLDGVAKTYYPFSGHLVGTPQFPTLDYNYAAPRSVYYTLNDPTLYPISNNLYTNFWQNFIEEISDKYSKIMTAYFNLTAEDIRTIDFRDSFFVDGTYYRLNKIIDYSPIGNTLTKVELIKIRDAVFIPSDSFSHGNVDLTTVSVGTPPFISTEVLEGQIIAGDAQGLGVAQTLSQDVIIDSSARVTVKGLRGRDIQDVAPANGDVYQWVAANSRWEPAASGGSGTVTSVNAGTNISVTGTAAAPIINSLSDRYLTSSTTSNSVSNGSKSFTVDLNLSYIPLQEILVVYDAANHMHGEVTSYNSATGALVVDIKNHTGSGTYTSWVLNLDGTPVDALSGSGTNNEIAYFTGAQILSSLAVATYPSLTELSYGKGVTSAIQTQINTKQATISLTTTGTSGAATFAANTLNIPIYSTGTAIVLSKTVTDVTVNATAETKVYSYTVAANTLAAGDILDLIARFRKTGTAGTMITRIRFGTNNSTADTLIAQMTSATATLTQNMQRTFLVKDATHIEAFQAASNVNTDDASSGSAVTSVTVNLAVTNYFVVTIQDASAVDTGIFSGWYLRKN